MSYISGSSGVFGYKDSTAMKWYNEPPVWNVQDDAIAISSGAKTDFWRQTRGRQDRFWLR